MKWKDDCPLRVASINRKELCLGITLVFCSFLMPLFFDVQNFHVYTSLWRAMHNWERTDLMVAALQLVALNSIRGIPHYVGSFFIGESLELRLGKHKAWLLNTLLIIVILQISYWGIEAVHDIRYDFGIPAVLVSAFVVVFGKLNYRYISLMKKAQMIALFLTALQFLDLMPLLGRFPVGCGETSWDIKQAAVLLDGEAILNAMTVVGTLLFFSVGLLIFFLLRDENNLWELGALREQNQEILIQSQLNEMQNRTHREVQYLVHDLKSPLTAMQTLVGIIKMECEMEQRLKDIEYLDRIEDAVEQMSRMISEILYEDHRGPVTTQALVSVALAQASVTDYAHYVHVENQAPDAVISANRFLLPRVLVNLLQNSAQAMPDGRTPEIWLRVRREEQQDGTGRIVFVVSDNGKGIDEEQRNAIWNRRVSGKNSSGLGLAFVRNVVEQLGGEIRMESTVGEGTTISVVLPQKEEA